MDASKEVVDGSWAFGLYPEVVAEVVGADGVSGSTLGWHRVPPQAVFLQTDDCGCKAVSFFFFGLGPDWLEFCSASSGGFCSVSSVGFCPAAGANAVVEKEDTTRKMFLASFTYVSP